MDLNHVISNSVNDSVIEGWDGHFNVNLWILSSQIIHIGLYL